MNVPAPLITELPAYELFGELQRSYRKAPEQDKEAESEASAPTYTQEDLAKEILRRLNLLQPPQPSHHGCHLTSFSPVKGKDNQPISGLWEAKYSITQSTQGAQGTTLTATAILTIDLTSYTTQPRITAQIQFDTLPTHTAEDAFNRLGEWCLRIGSALTNRPTPRMKLPI